MYPSEFHSKPKILTHYNPYNLNEEKWEEYKFVCVVNNYQKSILQNALMMPLCIDTSFFKFNRSNYTIEPIVNMSVNRIEGKKGVYEVAKACKELNYKFIQYTMQNECIKKFQTESCLKSLDFNINMMPICPHWCEYSHWWIISVLLVWPSVGR
jgi:hypothetical protein